MKSAADEPNTDADIGQMLLITTRNNLPYYAQDSVLLRVKFHITTRNFAQSHVECFTNYNDWERYT